MQGEGTKESPYIPTAWDEFVYAVGKEGGYVEMPKEAGVFNMNDIDPTGKLTVEIKSLYIYGNDWTIQSAWNTKFSFLQPYETHKDLSGSWIAWSNGAIYNLHFKGYYCDKNPVVSLTYGKLVKCKISGINDGETNAIYAGEMEQCSLKVKFMGKSKNITGNTVNRTRMQFCRVEIDSSDSQSAPDQNVKASYTKIAHITNSNNNKMEFSGSNNLYLSDAGNYITDTSQKKHIVTAEQLSDVAYMRSIGFPIMR